MPSRSDKQVPHLDLTTNERQCRAIRLLVGSAQQACSPPLPLQVDSAAFLAIVDDRRDFLPYTWYISGCLGMFDLSRLSPL